MKITLSPDRIEDYKLFLRIKGLPKYKIQGREAWFPDEYASHLGLEIREASDLPPYVPSPFLFDYQSVIASIAIKKRKYCLFIEPGRGKTLIASEYLRYVDQVLPRDKAALILSPSMIIDQTLDELSKFYSGSLQVERLKSSRLAEWMVNPQGSRIAITNYEALNNSIPQGRLGCLIPDELSILAAAYGKWSQEILRLGKGLEWKLGLTGTPAPNDRIEYANYAVFLDVFPTHNSFLARYFVNKGNTGERWEMKPNAVEAFYREMSHWCIFMTDPAVYSWVGSGATIPPIRIHVEDVEMTDAQHAASRNVTGMLFACDPGGIGKRAKLAKIAKTGDSLKPAWIREKVESWPDRSTVVWCRFNDEQERLEKEMPNAASVSGDTKDEERQRIINAFKRGEIKTLISKPKLLGYGLNLQIATRHIFSSVHDSFVEFFQAIKRSNRVGSKEPLEVYIPVQDVERPMVENVLRKARNIQEDIAIQERLFKDASII